MKAPVRVLQVRDGEMQIALGRGEGAVAEQLLDVTETGVIADEMGSAGMPPDVRGDFFPDAAEPRVFGDELIERGAAQRGAFERNEQGGAYASAQRARAHGIEVAPQERAGALPPLTRSSRSSRLMSAIRRCRSSHLRMPVA